MPTSTTQASADWSPRARARGVWAEAMRIARGADERDRAQRDAVAAFAVRVASAGILYLSQVVMARWIGGANYGIYVFVWSFVLLLGGLSGLGLNLGMMRLVPEYGERGQTAELRGLLLGGRLIALGAGTVVAALGLAALWLLQSHISELYLVPACLALVCVPLYALTDVQDGIGRGSGWMGIALLPPYVLRPLLLLAAMAAAHVAGLTMTAVTAAGSAIVATWGAGLIQTMMLARRLRAAVKTGPRSYEASRWLATSLPLVVIVGAEIMLQNTDIFVLSRFVDPAEIGIYYAATKTMSLIMFVHYAVGSAVANRFAGLRARGDEAALSAFVHDAVHWTFWPSLAAAALILALGMPLLWLFGPQFTHGYPVMLVMVLGFLARASTGPAEFLLNMLGEARLGAAILFGTVVLNIGLNLALVPRFGILGAASATATSLAISAALQWFAVRRQLGFDVAIWSNLRRAAAV